MKSKLRIQFKNIRSGISPGRREFASKSCQEALEKITVNHLYVLSFSSLPDEINLWPLNKTLEQEKKLLLPKVQNKELKIYWVDDIENGLSLSKSFSILEPISSKCMLFEKLNSVTLAIIPGLAFDKSNHRLGYGFGYYDFLLAKLKNCYKIGVGFKEQLYHGSFPLFPHDIQLDEILLF